LDYRPVVVVHVDRTFPHDDVPPDPAPVLGLGPQPFDQPVGGDCTVLVGGSGHVGGRVELVERLQHDTVGDTDGEHLGGDGEHQRPVTVDQIRHRRVDERCRGEHGAEAELGPQVPVDVVGGLGRPPCLQVRDDLLAFRLAAPGFDQSSALVKPAHRRSNHRPRAAPRR
jgi:hypothetical protein